MHCSAASVKTGAEFEMRKKILESGLVRCMVALPTQLFTNTTLPVHIWILSRKPESRQEIVMIDAYDFGKLNDANQRLLSSDEINTITRPYLDWKHGTLSEDSEVGLFRCVPYSEVIENNYILSPNRYVKHMERVNYSVEVTFSHKKQSAVASYCKSISESEEKLLGNGSILSHNSIECFLNSLETSSIQTELGDVIASIIGGEWGDETQKKDTEPCIVLRGTDLPNVKLFNFAKTPVRYIKSAKVAEKKVQVGDIIVEMSGGSKDQPTGRTAFITQELVDWFNC